ncbi:MAG: hypothetical protein Q9179_007176, partial [Wetmoreana sp. 5 TL-2023]
MQCYTELTPPTAVSHSLSLPFLSASANNLVVAKTSLLQIFTFRTIVPDPNASLDTSSGGRRASLTGAGLSNSVTGTLQRGDRAPTTKLILVAQYELSGIITSLARIKVQGTKSGGEALLVSVRNAKVSLIEWDPERYSISTISIHLYEREDTQGNPWEPVAEDHVNYLSVDPHSRCAALKFGARHLAILPFHQQGDDLVMDDYDPDIDDERSKPAATNGKGAKEDGVESKTPYSASFVLSMLALDPSLLHPVHLAFLYEYREPTFGILSSQVASSNSLLQERRDTLSYTVITLDLEQRASTALLSVNSLPGDLFGVVPLRSPISGSLLVGGNELIHVDQAGKANGAAVNDFARINTSFALADQSDLGFRLEGCVIEQFGYDSIELLLILNTGELAIVGFKIDGRSVSGLSIRRVPEQNGGSSLLAGPSCASLIGRGRMFIGSEDADSVVIGWSRRLDKLRRRRSVAETDADEEVSISDIEEDIDDDDDLYATAPTEEKQKLAAAPATPDQTDDYHFRVHDLLENFGPMRSIALGKPDRGSLTDTQAGNVASQELLTTAGRGRAGGLTTFRRELDPRISERHLVPNVDRLWAISAVKSTDALSSDLESFDNYIITSTKSSEEELRSAVYSLTSSGLEEMQETDFDPEAGATTDVGTLNSGSRIVQVLPSELRSYDADFSLAQIFPMADEATGAEPRIVSASFADPFVLLIRDDQSILVLRADEGGDLDEVEQGALVKTKRFRSGSLYEDSKDVFRLESEPEIEDDAGNILMFLLTVEGGLQVGLDELDSHSLESARISALELVDPGLSLLPPFLSPDFSIRRNQAKEDLRELLVTELGDATHKTPYLILRSAADDLIIYQPYQASKPGSRDTLLHLLKISSLHLAKYSIPETYDEDQSRKREPLRPIIDVNNYSAVFMPGEIPIFIIKSASSPPKLVSMRDKPVRSLTQLNTARCKKGFAYIDQKGSINFAQLPANSHYSTGWITRKVPFGEDVHAVDYHGPSATYVVGVSQRVDFRLPDDETHPEWAAESISFYPQVEQGTIKLLDQQTWSFIDEYPLSPAEVVMSIKTMHLEMSENTHERQDVVVVGTAIIRGEDLPAQGKIYVFIIIDVVPEPDRPETGHRLKLIAREETKGAVTALSEIGTQGFLLAAQGQKCMVRGLKEDGSLLPVAFMDMQCYTSVVKELKGTGMCLMGDAVKGLWFTGYYEDPYQLRLFGKSSDRIEVLAADFLPDGKQLYLVVADADSNVHILQFDPE